MTTPGCALSVTAHHRVTGLIVLAAFRAAVARYGPPAATLTDNGMVFTTRLPGGKGGRNGLETDLRRLGITQKNGRPNHPQTQGKAGQVPADHEEMAPRPASQPRLPSPSSRQLLDTFSGSLQHPAAAPLAAGPRHPSHHLRRPPQSHARQP